jgi:ribosomal protein S18 acetylase RimI-like enzyme
MKTGKLTNAQYQKLKRHFSKTNGFEWSMDDFIKSTVISIPHGFVVLDIYDEVEELPRFGNLTFIYVDEKYRGQGIGAKLYRKTIEYFKSESLSEFYLTIAYNNPKSLALAFKFKADVYEFCTYFSNGMPGYNIKIKTNQ